MSLNSVKSAKYFIQYLFDHKNSPDSKYLLLTESSISYIYKKYKAKFTKTN